MDGNILESVRKELRAASDKKTKEATSRFFKEPVLSYGVKTSVVSAIGKKYLKEIKGEGKKKIFRLAEQLFQSDYMEEAFIASDWVYAMRNEYEKDDFSIFERWIARSINNWAKCDTFCNHSMGAFIEMYPSCIATIKKTWTASKNRWVKRAAAVSFIIPAKRGKYLDDVFAIADKLLTDPDDMVQKGYGWLLKEASRIHQKEVFDYVCKRKRDMPRTALRYAIEKMPDHMRKEAMKKA